MGEQPPNGQEAEPTETSSDSTPQGNIGEVECTVTGPRLDHTGPTPEVAPSAHLVLGYRRCALGAAVLRAGADVARRLNATLHVVHVVDLSDYPIDPDAWDWEQQAERTLAAEKCDVETALATQPTSWTYHAAHGNPVALLRRVADEHDAFMFIVGTRGEGVGSIISRFIGNPSVSHGLIARTHRPVLVVPPHAAPSPPDPRQQSWTHFPAR